MAAELLVLIAPSPMVRVEWLESKSGWEEEGVGARQRLVGPKAPVRSVQAVETVELVQELASTRKVVPERV